MHGHEETTMNLKRPNSIMPTPARYTGPLEYLTMWMCLFLSPAVLERLRDLQAQEPDWTRLRGIRVKLSAAQAIHPHVLDVLQGMMGGSCLMQPKMDTYANALQPDKQTLHMMSDLVPAQKRRDT